MAYLTTVKCLLAGTPSLAATRAVTEALAAKEEEAGGGGGGGCCCCYDRDHGRQTRD